MKLFPQATLIVMYNSKALIRLCTLLSVFQTVVQLHYVPYLNTMLYNTAMVCNRLYIVLYIYTVTLLLVSAYTYRSSDTTKAVLGCYF